MGKKPANKPEVIPQPPLRPNAPEAGPPAGVCGRGRLTCTASRMLPAGGEMNPEILATSPFWPARQTNNFAVSRMGPAR